jgi:Transposase DDE domain
MAHAESLCERHRYTIEVPEKPRQRARTATVAVGFGRAHIERPVRLPRGDLPDTVAMTVVVVREVDPPAAAEPVRWVLLTTHAVTDLEGALAVVGWYRKRWLIEQLFRTLKTQGFNVEESQVVEAHALMNLVTPALIAAMQTLQLTLARDGATRQPVSDAFAAGEVRALKAVERKLPGRTAKQLNPHPPDSLAWAAWIIARLGGWTGYASQKPPGPKTMHLGLTHFQALAHGWLLCEEEV